MNTKKIDVVRAKTQQQTGKEVEKKTDTHIHNKVMEMRTNKREHIWCAIDFIIFLCVCVARAQFYMAYCY